MQVSGVWAGVALVLIGCAGCSEKKPPHQALNTKPNLQKVSYRPETKADKAAEKSQETEFKISDVLNKPVRDKAGKEVARVDDLVMGQNGRISSVTLVLKNEHGDRKITVPFDAIRAVRDEKGGLLLESALPLDIQPTKDEQSKSSGDYKPASPAGTPAPKVGDPGVIVITR